MTNKVYVCKGCGWMSDSRQIHTNCFGELREMIAVSDKGNASVGLYLTNQEKARLLEIASQVSAVSRAGRYAGKPTVSALMQQIADGQLELAKNKDFVIAERAKVRRSALYLSTRQKDVLTKLADEFGATVINGRRIGQASANKLVEWIAQGKLKVEQS